VADTGCGVIVPFGDPEAAAQAILDLWNDPDRRRQMAVAGHRVARARYDWTIHAQDFVAELEQAARSARRQ
jgi:glycosyltransferase involved in cell wall biosynthesis